MSDDAIAAALADVAGGIMEVDDSKLRVVSKFAERQLWLEARCGEIEEMLKEAQAELKRVSEIDLPNAMVEAGMKEFTLLDGSKIAISKIYAASIKVDDKPVAFKWLINEGHEALMKVDVIVPFGRGDYEKAKGLSEAIAAVLKKRKMDVHVQLDQSVHWQTLRAFVKEQIEAEEKAINDGLLVAKDALFPRELFGVYIIDKAKITPKK